MEEKSIILGMGSPGLHAQEPTDAAAISIQLGLEKLGAGEKVMIVAPGIEHVSEIFHMLTKEQQEMIVLVDENNLPKDISHIHRYRPREEDLVELKLFDERYPNEAEAFRPEYGYQKHRNGTNKKYIKRKKAKNGRTKKRRK